MKSEVRGPKCEVKQLRNRLRLVTGGRVVGDELEHVASVHDAPASSTRAERDQLQPAAIGTKLPATAGHFPQVSGLTLRVDPNAPAGNRVRDVLVGGKPIDPKATYTLALPDFLLKGGDGYAMFAAQRVLIAPEAGRLLVEALEKRVAEQKTIAPTIDGRIVIR